MQTTPVLFDAHLHLDDDSPHELFERARAAGVGLFVVVGTDLAGSRRAAAVARKEGGVFATVGVHPHEAGHFDGDLGPFRDLLSEPDVVAVGEVGLDYHYDFSPRPVQRRVFRAFLELAVEMGLPVVVHCREAYDDCLALLRDSLPEGHPVLLHSFTAAPEQAERFLAAGVRFSFNGIATFRKADEVRATLAWIPSDRLLVETDSPYLAPHPHRGKRNEPALLPFVVETVARVRKWTIEEAARRTTINACSFYRVSPPS